MVIELVEAHHVGLFATVITDRAHECPIFSAVHFQVAFVTLLLFRLKKDEELSITLSIEQKNLKTSMLASPTDAGWSVLHECRPALE